MDLILINQEIARLMQSPQTALLAGVVASLTPCTLALIPIFLYRFGIWGGKKEGEQPSTLHIAKELSLVILGYIITFVLFGWFMNTLFGSDFVNIVRLALGTALVFFGIMQLGGQISFNFINKISNPVATGAAIPLVISFSPCVLPVIAPLVASGSSDGSSIISFVLFGVGILLPASLLALGGNKLMKFFRGSSKVIAYIERFSAILIIASGIYLSGQLLNITKPEIAISSVLLLAMILVLGYLVIKKQDLKTVRNIGMLSLILVAWVGVSLVSSANALDGEAARGQDLIYACSAISEHFTTETMTISGSFAVIGLALGWFYITRSRGERRVDFKLSTVTT